MPPTTANTRLKVFTSLQAGRAIAAIIVVFHHCGVILNNPKYWHTSWAEYVYCGRSGVEIFFVLSGIVILYAHTRDIGNPAKLGSYLWKRTRRIYPIYWIVMLATMPVFVLIPSFGRGSERQPMVILQSILLLPLQSMNRVLPVSWTLFHEIMFYAVFSTVILNRRIGAAVVTVWIAASAYALVFPFANPVVAAYLSPLHLLFAFGMGVTLFVRRYSIPGWPIALAGLAGFIVCCVRDNQIQDDNYMPLAVAYGAFATLMLCGAMLMEQRGQLRSPAWLVLIGDASYSIYLVHFPVVSAGAKVLYPIWKHFKTPLIVPYLLLVILGMALGLVVHLLVEKPLLAWMSKPKQVAPKEIPAASV
jgi:peptidoglycan/LPS O-acetylase OafA/YrhL